MTEIHSVASHSAWNAVIELFAWCLYGVWLHLFSESKAFALIVQLIVLPQQSFTAASVEVNAKSAFLNKESLQREVKATLSQKVILSCEVIDNKAEVRWYKDSKQLSSSRALHLNSKGKVRQLVIDSIEKKDAGEYICEVGHEKLAFKVHVAGTVWVMKRVNFVDFEYEGLVGLFFQLNVHCSMLVLHVIALFFWFLVALLK